MIGLDTNVVVRYLVSEESEQTNRARAIFQTMLSEEEPGFLSAVVIAETAWVLKRSYRFSDREIAGAFLRLLEANELVFDNTPDIYAAIEAVEEDNVDFADALIGALARSNGCAIVLTFDRGALRLPGFVAA